MEGLTNGSDNYERLGQNPKLVINAQKVSCSNSRLNFQNEEDKTIEETEELLKRKLQEFRLCIHDDPELKFPEKIFDDYLLSFLRCSKFDVPNTLRKYKKYCELQHKALPMVQLALRPRSFADLLKTNICVPLRCKDPKGRTIILMQIRKWDSRKYCLDLLLATMFQLACALIKDSQVQRHGVIGVVDFSGISLHQISQLTFSKLTIFLALLQGGFPIKIKQIHIVNNLMLFNVLYRMAKPFLTTKIRQRLYFHGHNTEKLTETVGAEHLPEFLGGSLPEDDLIQQSYIDLIFNGQAFNKELSLNLSLKKDCNVIANFAEED